MGVVIGGVDTPLVPSMGLWCVLDPISHRVLLTEKLLSSIIIFIQSVVYSRVFAYMYIYPNISTSQVLKMQQIVS